MRQGRADVGVCQLGQFAAGHGVGVDEWQKVQPGVYSVLMRDALQRAIEAVIVDVGYTRVGGALGVKVVQGDGLDWRIGILRGLQQTWVEAAQAQTVGGGALGEDQYAVTLLESLADKMQRVLAVAALDEQASGALRQPADQRPGAHFGLGEKTYAGKLAAKHRNVQPGERVAKVEYASLLRLMRLPLCLHMNFQGTTYPAMPMAHGARAACCERGAVERCLCQADEQSGT